MQVGDPVYWIGNGPCMYVIALIKDHKSIPWAVECGWFDKNDVFRKQVFALELVTIVEKDEDNADSS